MLKEEKIRLMTKLARYESGEGKEELRIARYYRSDYIGLALFRNFFPGKYRISGDFVTCGSLFCRISC